MEGTKEAGNRVRRVRQGDNATWHRFEKMEGMGRRGDARHPRWPFAG